MPRHGRHVKRLTGSLLDRRAFLGTLAGGLAARRPAEARPAPPRVGDLSIAGSVIPPQSLDEYRDVLLEAVGTRAVFAHRDAGGRPDRLPAAAAELVGMKVDVIVARGRHALRAATQATRTIPLVALDLESDAGATRPAENVTGLFLDLADLAGKHLDLLRQLAPALSRLTVLGDPEVHVPQFRATERAGQARSIRVETLEIRSAQEYSDAFSPAPTRGDRTSALLVLSSPVLLAYRRELAAIATERALPTLFMYRTHVEAGGLVSYGPDPKATVRQCAAYVARILAGGEPEAVPMRQPARFDLAVNLHTARALGLTIPPSVLGRADQLG